MLSCSTAKTTCDRHYQWSERTMFYVLQGYAVHKIVSLGFHDDGSMWRAGTADLKERGD